MQKSLLPPRAARRPVSATHHGHTRTDDFAWLRAENWQEVMRNPAALAPEIKAYLDAENSYFAGEMADNSPRNAKYRPVGLAVGPDGSLFISDSQKGRIWRIRYGK